MMFPKASNPCERTAYYAVNNSVLLCICLIMPACGGDDLVGARGVCQVDLDCRTQTICFRAACIPIEQIDADGDGIPDPIEIMLGTNPRNPDSDGDGIRDGDEVTMDPDTRTWTAPDGDQDGVPDALENDSGDDDDDGVPNAVDPCDDDPNCPIVGGAHPPCRVLEDEPCAVGLGTCAGVGRTVCSDNGQDVVCAGETGEPVDELCDNLDNDCDGEVDEIFMGLTEACTVGIGECQSQGVIRCGENGEASCDAPHIEATVETCDGLDNDCDDTSDEDFAELGERCTRGTDECTLQGEFACDLDTGDTICQVEQTPEVVESCDGLDNDCDGSTDEGFEGLGDVCEFGLGQCVSQGLNICSVNGSAVLCDASPGAASGELCNQMDDDCDGLVDEVFPGIGTPCAVGTGICRREAMTTCSNDGASTTCPAVPGAPDFEICDAVDNDCDGSTDENLGVGDLCRAGIGQCLAEGQQVCAPGVGGLRCNAIPSPGLPELCDGLDNDCDGSRDEDFADLAAPCEAGRGACRVPGVMVCRVDRLGTECGADPNGAIRELCDGHDNDCDGAVDEGLRLGEQCLVGQNACRAEGVNVCNEANEVVCDAEVPQGEPERCDGFDNDCDFRTDEDFDVQGLGQACNMGMGSCTESGQWICSDDQLTLVCNAIPGQPSPEACDEIDNDCDGSFDEDYPDLDQMCEVGIGACRRQSRLACSADGRTVLCPAEPLEPQAESCNRFDDDCDGMTDENYPALGDVCAVGVGACEAAGALVCTEEENGTRCSVEPSQPSDEVCDQIDNDCDGSVDENFGPNCSLLARAVVSGGYGSCAVLPSGATVCWGSVRRQPPEATLSYLSAGGDIYCGIDAGNQLRCWGQPPVIPIDLGEIDAVSVGANGHVCVIERETDRVRCFGRGPVSEIDPPAVPLHHLTSGFDFACALDHDEGRPTCWGAADFGVLDAPDTRFSMIDSGASVTCGLRLADGTIDCWGDDIAGQLDPPEGAFVALSMGGYTGCAISPEGALACWGLGSLGDVGQYGQAAPPALLMDTVSMGAAHGCGLTVEQGIACWGAGSPGDDSVFPHSGQSTPPR
jgi:hypothetical protein